MKRLLLSSVVLLTFSASISLFEISCKKSANAQSNTNGATTSNLGVIMYTKINSNTSVGEIWLANYDGSNQHIVPITPIPGYSVGRARLTPDGKKIFISAYNGVTAKNTAIFSCNVDGSNLVKVIDDPSGQVGEIQGAY
jgi:Tol biopolymer transport system component